MSIGKIPILTKQEPDTSNMEKHESLWTSHKQDSKGILICSIDHGGATNLIKAITMGSLTPNKKNNIRTSFGEIICYKPFIMDEEDLKMKYSVSIIDAGFIGNKTNEQLKMSLGTLMTISGVIVCARLGRWNKKMLIEMIATAEILRKLNMPVKNTVICITGTDIYNELTINSYVKDMNELSLNGVKFLSQFKKISGCFADTDSLSETGDKVLKPFIVESLIKVYQEINSMQNIDNVVSLKVDLNDKSDAEKDKKKKRDKAVELKDVILKPTKLSGDVERRILLVGQTGCGKSAIINLFFQDQVDAIRIKQPSKQSAISVTKKCLRTNAFGIKKKMAEGQMDDEKSKFSCQLIDTVGFGDADHTTEDVKRDLLYEMYEHLTQIDIMIFCLKIEASDVIVKDLSEILQWLTTILHLKPNNVFFVFTYRDFYSVDYINSRVNYLSEIKGFKGLIRNQNFEVSSAPNEEELNKLFVRYFDIMRNNLLVRLYNEIVKERDRICASNMIRDLFNKLKKEKGEDYFKDIDELLNV